VQSLYLGRGGACTLWELAELAHWHPTETPRSLRAIGRKAAFPPHPTFGLSSLWSRS